LDAAIPSLPAHKVLSIGQMLDLLFTVMLFTR